MEKRKLKLDEIKVESFITSLEGLNIEGGSYVPPTNDCNPYTGATGSSCGNTVCANTCAASCNGSCVNTCAGTCNCTNFGTCTCPPATAQYTGCYC